ncbi:hypothetical protein Tco_1152812 [Tanacetum coccineum]
MFTNTINAISKIPKEFWCIIVLDHPTPPTEDFEARPLKESNIKFTVKNGKTPLILDYKTFCQTTGLEYNNVNYVSHPSTKEVKVELANISAHEVLVSPLPASEKKEKKKLLTVTKPKPKSQGPKASRALHKKGKNAKTKQTTLIQTSLKLTQPKELSEATDTSQSVSSGHVPSPQDTESITDVSLCSVPGQLEFRGK